VKNVPELGLLLKRTQELLQRIDSDQETLLEEDLLAIFLELQELISPNDLKTGLSVLENGTLLLGRKIDEVKRFILYLTEKDQIIQYLETRASDEELADIFNKVWHMPVILPQVSVSFFSESWMKLVSNKTQPTPFVPSEIAPIMEKQPILLAGNTELFEVSMNIFLNEIKMKLPASIDTLLEGILSQEVYFEQFSFILHLLQGGYLSYNSQSKQFKLGEEHYE
jgi:hypothetical protein